MRSLARIVLGLALLAGACTALKEVDVVPDASVGAPGTPQGGAPDADAAPEAKADVTVPFGAQDGASPPEPAVDAGLPDTAPAADADLAPTDASRIAPDTASPPPDLALPEADAAAAIMDTRLAEPDAPPPVCCAGTRSCLSVTPRLCTPQGQWQDMSPCSGSTPICTEGACSPIEYSGRWVGATNQGYLFQMQVFANALTDLGFDYVAENSSCRATGHINTRLGTPEPIAAAASFAKGPFGSPPVTYSVSGDFSSATSASGTIQMTYAGPGCSKTQLLSWTARKVVCGDRRLEWPETCDDGNTMSGDACPAICQLAATPERENNDSIAQANGPYTDDVILTASLPTPADVDVFAIRNPYPGPVSIELETHGQTIGVCGVDTYLRLLDGNGVVLVEDDDGGRALSCSKIVHLLAAGQTVYAQIYPAAAGDTIPAYALHVFFQKP